MFCATCPNGPHPGGGGDSDRNVLPLEPPLINTLPFGPKIDRERILGLAGMVFSPSDADLRSLGVVVQSPALHLLTPRRDMLRRDLRHRYRSPPSHPRHANPVIAPTLDAFTILNGFVVVCDLTAQP